MNSAYEITDATPPKWAKHGGASISVKTPLGVVANAMRTRADKPWTLYQPDGGQGHLPASYNADQVTAYLKVLIKSAIVRLLATVREELPDCREGGYDLDDVTDNLLTELRLGGLSGKAEVS